MPAVKILKTPENAFLFEKRISGVISFGRINYSVTGLTDTYDLLSLFLLNSTSPSVSAKRV